MTTITVHTPARVGVPRAAHMAAAAFLALLGSFERRSKARAERRVQADRNAEAAAVREYAMRFAGHDPRFAADLLAAADRHERIEPI
jgi:hypothetical protein